MEYLPNDPHEKELIKQQKLEKNLKEFRQYLVDKGVVLAFVKVILSLKYSETKPKNPIKAIREFFGKYKDPAWDQFEILKQEILVYKQENPKLLEKVNSLQEELDRTKVSLRMKNTFRLFELDKNGLLSTKVLIEKLTGNKKFDVDEKFEINGYIKVLETIGSGDNSIKSNLCEALEKAAKGQQVFKDDQENTLYKKIFTTFKELKVKK